MITLVEATTKARDFLEKSGFALLFYELSEGTHDDEKKVWHIIYKKVISQGTVSIDISDEGEVKDFKKD